MDDEVKATWKAIIPCFGGKQKPFQVHRTHLDIDQVLQKEGQKYEDRMSQGIRHNQGKPQWSLIPMKAIEPGVRVLMQGAEKYGTNNWRKGLLTREICESLLRHVYAYLEGEDNDSESGQPHVGHIIANAIFLSDMHQTRPDMDNRFSKEKTCCGKWDEYGKCTCVDNRREREEPKGGVLNESNSRQIAENFANRLKNYLEEIPKVANAMQKFRPQPDRGRSLNTLKDFDDWKVDYGKPNLWGMPSLDDHVYWESSGIPNPAISAGQNANIGRSYPKENGCTCGGKICGVQPNGEVYYCNHKCAIAHVELLQRAYREKQLSDLKNT